jgi:hypothetical protein
LIVKGGMIAPRHRAWHRIERFRDKDNRVDLIEKDLLLKDRIQIFTDPIET